MALLMPLACALGAVHGSETTAEQFKLADASSEAAELYSSLYWDTETTLFPEKVKVMAHITENASRAAELIQCRRALRREFWRGHSPHELLLIDTSLQSTEMDLCLLDYFWLYLETIMSRSSTSPNEWPADYFAQQSSDVFLRATSSKSFQLKEGVCFKIAY